MKRIALATVLVAAITAGTAFAINNSQDRVQRTEREVRRERPNVHPLAMALEMQNKLDLNEEQLKHLQDKWSEYKEVRQHNNQRLQELEREMVAMRQNFAHFEEEMAGVVYESLGPDQRDMLRNQMREFNQRYERERDVDVRREGGQEREFEQMVAELRMMVDVGEITGNQAEERIDAYRRAKQERERDGGQEVEYKRAVAELKAAVEAGKISGNDAERRIAEMRQRMEQNSDVARKPKNPIGQHLMAYALEGQRKIGLTEKQTKTLQDAWREIYAAGNEIGGGMRELEMHTAELREAGEWNDRSAREVNARIEQLQSRLKELHDHATGILEDTLNKEQMNGAVELMMMARARQGSESKIVNPMNGHPMAWALEMHESLKLSEKQVARIRETYTGLRREGEGLNERQADLQRKLTELRESGRLTDGNEREFEGAFKRIGADREALQAKGSKVLQETLNKEQLAQLRKRIEEQSRNDG